MKKQNKKISPLNILVWLCYIFVGIDAYVSLNRVIGDIFILLTIIIVIDGIYFVLVNNQIRINLETDEVFQKDEEFNLKVRVINQSYFPMPYLYIIPKSSTRADLIENTYIGLLLGSKEQVEHSILYKAKLCGLEELSLEKINLRSFFSFFQKDIVIKENVKIKILPKIRPIQYIENFDSLLGELTLSIGAGKKIDQECMAVGNDEIGYELRPYVPGDSQKLIHWKIAAYKNELLVRQRHVSNEQKGELIFILNPFIRDDKKRAIDEDKLLTSLISLVSYYVQCEQRVCVAYYKNKIWRYMKLTSVIHLQQLQEELAEYSFCGDEEIASLKKIIKSPQTNPEHNNGIKIIVSNYWISEIEQYTLSKEQMSPIPYVWTGNQLPEVIDDSSKLLMWQITDDYNIALSFGQEL